MVTQKKKQNHREAGRYYAMITSPCSLQWISAIATAILMLVKGTGINKSYLVPLFALQAPASVISWIQGEYGAWSAFLALIVRLFFFIPGELELPFMTLLFVIVAPYQAMKLRGVQPGIITSLVIAGYLAFQHFSRAGSLEKAFNQGAIIATLAVIAITAVPLLLLV